MGVAFSMDLDRGRVNAIIDDLKNDLNLNDRKAYLETLSRTNGGGSLLVKASKQWKISLIQMKEELDNLESTKGNQSANFAQLKSTFDDELKKSEETLTLAKTICSLDRYIQEIQPTPETPSIKEQNQEILSVQKQPKTQPKKSTFLLFQPKPFKEVDISDEEMAKSVFGQRRPNRYNPFN